jgi:glycosyltransferase involved in cell wall biosynthesis
MRPKPLGPTSIVLATYERADALDLVLRSLAEQEAGDGIEVVVADDGSGDEVAAVVERWRGQLPLVHVWQPNEGFRKARAMNLGALAATGDYLLFLDADCVPRRGFTKAVRRAAYPGWFLTTKRVALSEHFSRRVLERQIPIWRWSAGHWLLRAPHEVRRPGYLVPARDRRRPWRTRQPEFVPPVAAYCLFGLFREDFERVNGYDARCVHSNDGEDQDLAIRLRRSGLRCGWPGPASTVLHLWHPTRSERSRTHQPLFRETIASAHVEALIGLRELEAQASANRVVVSSSSSEPEKR